MTIIYVSVIAKFMQTVIQYANAYSSHVSEKRIK